MAYTLESRTSSILTESDARKAKASKAIPGERPLKPARINFITELLSDGRFFRADFAYADCGETGHTYRVNGQHCGYVLVACIDNEELPDFPQGVPMVVEHWKCDFLSELILIFDTYDNCKSNRTAGDALGVHRAHHREALDGVSPEAVKWALDGVNFAKRMANDPDDPHHPSMTLGLILREEGITDFCSFIQDLKDAPYLGIKDKGICAAIYRSWLENPERASEVWSYTFDEVADNPNSDSRKFVNNMRTARSKGRKVKSFDWFYNQAKRYWVRQRNAKVAS